MVLSLPVSNGTDLNADEYWISELIEWKTKRGPTSRQRLVEGTSDCLRLESKNEADIHCCRIPESLAKFNGDRSGDQWFVQQEGLMTTRRVMITTQKDDNRDNEMVVHEYRRDNISRTRTILDITVTNSDC